MTSNWIIAMEVAIPVLIGACFFLYGKVVRLELILELATQRTLLAQERARLAEERTFHAVREAFNKIDGIGP